MQGDYTFDPMQASKSLSVVYRPETKWGLLTCKNKNMGLKSPFLLLFVTTTLVYFVKADWNTHSSASDLYIHSNDTFTLELSDDQPNQLHGAPGTRRTLDFMWVKIITKVTKT